MFHEYWCGAVSLSLFFCLLHGLLQHISQGVSHSLVTVNLYLLKKGFSFCLPLEPGTKMSYCAMYTLFFDTRHPSALSLVLVNFVHLSVSIAPNKLLGSFFYLKVISPFIRNRGANFPVQWPILWSLFLLTQGYTPLHLAAMHGRDAVIKMLVSEYGELKTFYFYSTAIVV